MVRVVYDFSKIVKKMIKDVFVKVLGEADLEVGFCPSS